MFARRTIVLLLLAGAILLSLVFPISLIAQDRTRLGQTRVATEPNDNESGYTLTIETPYYKSSPQQGRAPDGKFAPGTKVNLLKRGGPYSLVQSANGIRVYVSTDALQPAQEAEGKNLPRTGIREEPATGTTLAKGPVELKVAIFRKGDAARPITTSKLLPQSLAPPKPLDLEKKLGLVKSAGIQLQSAMSNPVYSKLTPAQPSDAHGQLQLFSAMIYSGAVPPAIEPTDATGGYGIAYWESPYGLEPLVVINIKLSGNLYVLDFTVATSSGDVPFTVSSGSKGQGVSQSVPMVNGHVLAVVENNGGGNHVAICPANLNNLKNWHFYCCEVSEIQNSTN
jgi:hypothetical protein